MTSFIRICGLLIGMALLGTSARAEVDEQPADSLMDGYAWKAWKLFVWKDVADQTSNRQRLHYDEFKAVLDDPLQTSEHRYLAASAYSMAPYSENDLLLLKRLCNEYPPRPDDFIFANRCLYVADLDVDKRIELVTELGEKAYKAHPNRMDGSLIFSFLADYLTNLTRLNEGLRANKRQLEMTPPWAESEIAGAKLSLALAFSNPLFSEKLHKQSIVYYKEVIDWYKQQPQLGYRAIEQVASYNLAIAYLFIFQDYEAAAEAFKKASVNEMVDVDSRVFLGFIYAKTGQAAAARQMLGSIQLSPAPDVARFNFLSCYRDLAYYTLGDKVSIQHCLQLESPQSDVLLHLTETLSHLDLPAKDENIWWRMFYRSFHTNILPDLQKVIESASSETELVRERAESRLKDLKLQNLTLYQYLVGALGVLAVLLGIGGFLTWKARTHAHQERDRLQNILDSIDEGIFLIHADLSMMAEESQHLKDLLGARYRSQMGLEEFLSLTSMDADMRATQLACIKTSMDEDALVWDLNHGNLVANISLGDKYLALFWKPVFQKNHLRAIFLALRDVTSEHLLKQSNNKAQQDADKVLVYVRQILKGNTQAVVRFLSTLQTRMNEIEDQIHAHDYTAPLRSLHTLKGTARSLQLNGLSETAHRLEDRLQKGEAVGLIEGLAETRSVMRLYLAAQHFVSEGSHHSAVDLLQIVSDLRAGVETHLHAAGIALGEILVRETGHLTASEYETVREILLHGLTNASDHGFILPAQQGQMLRSPEIAVELHSDERQRRLVIRDNGVGIQHATLQKMAEARGWQPQPGETWSDFLFTDGVTTAGAVTISSGRGVGLSAVRQAAQSMGGRVRLRDNEGTSGALLEITWDAPLPILSQAV